MPSLLSLATSSRLAEPNTSRLTRLTSRQVVQANVLKSSTLQGILLVSAFVIKPILRSAVGLRANDGLTSSVFYFGFHVRTPSEGGGRLCRPHERR